MSDLLTAARQALKAIESFIGLELTVGQRYTNQGQALLDTLESLRTAIEQAERQTTHSDECWRWHHACAVAKIERGIGGGE